MRRFLRRWLAPVVLALCGGLSVASAGDNEFKDLHPNAGQGITQPNAPAPADVGDKPEKPAPVFAYFLAVMAAIVVLSILCVPSRKAESATARR